MSGFFDLSPTCNNPVYLLDSAETAGRCSRSWGFVIFSALNIVIIIMLLVVSMNNWALALFLIVINIIFYFALPIVNRYTWSTYDARSKALEQKGMSRDQVIQSFVNETNVEKMTNGNSVVGNGVGSGLLKGIGAGIGFGISNALSRK